MSHANRAARHAAGGYPPIAQIEPDSSDEGVDTEALMAWLRRHQVLLGGLVLIAAQLAWKANFLSHMYFSQDDFYNLDLALKSPLTWHYLTFIGVGHLMIGLRLIAWLLVRHSLYDWGLASAVVLVLLTASSLAALRLMRTLFGDRLVILIPLAAYLLIPITVPDLGWWSAALESLPLQLAIFMSLNAHVWYVRTGRAFHLAASAAWLCFGLAFFEKALVLPVLLFGITAAYFGGQSSFLAGARQALVRFWPAWLVYAVLTAAGAILLAISLRTSTIHPRLPSSPGGPATFAWALVRDTLIPGMLGGPWRWFPIYGGAYSIGLSPPALKTLALVGVVLIIGVSIWRRSTAWRSWAIFAIWVAGADLAPIIVSRVNTWYPSFLALDTRYVADAAAVLVICLGLAILPLAGQEDGAPDKERSTRTYQGSTEQALRLSALTLCGIFVFGSILSVQEYENDTTGLLSASYMANATQALKLVKPGTTILDAAGPLSMVNPFLGKYQYTSAFIGYTLGPNRGRNMRWTAHPYGTIDGLMMFGSDGRLHPAVVSGAASPPRTVKEGCWPERYGAVTVKFAARTSIYTWALRIGYIWYSKLPSQITVHYGDAVQSLDVRPGLHSAYMPVAGSVSNFTIDGLGGNTICVGDAEAGIFVQA
jgi:hypothetical protein